MLGNQINIDTTVSIADELFGQKQSFDGYEELSSTDTEGLLLESPDVEDVELEYMGDELLAAEVSVMFEAITTKRIRLAQTMRAFIRVLNRGLNGTDIRAGADDAGVDVEGQNTVSGAIIGKVRKVAGVPVMTALIPLSDGQSTSIIFHSPTADGPRIKNNDLLVAFQFLLNKRDVTHVVAPIGGRDVSLNQVCQVLSNLIERNSGKFKKAQEKQDKLRTDIQALEGEADKLEEERSVLIGQVDQAQTRLGKAKENYSDADDKLRAQQAINTDLTAYLEQLKRQAQKTVTRQFTEQVRTVKKRLIDNGETTVGDASIKTEGDEIVISAPGGETYKISSAGDGVDKAATVLLKAYRDGDAAKYLVPVEDSGGAHGDPQGTSTHEDVNPPPQNDGTIIQQDETEPVLEEHPEEPQAMEVGAYQYALMNRPAGIGAVPGGQMAVLPRPDEGSAFHEYARHGVITYNRQLSDEEIRQFELKYLPPESEYSDIARAFVAKGFDKYAAEYLQMSEEDKDTFEKTVRSKFRKDMEHMAFPKGSAEGVMMKKIINALAETTQGQPELEPVHQEADNEANQAIQFLKSIIALESNDMGQLREARSQVRGAIASLQSAGVFDENENLVNDAVRHLSDLLVAIQKNGGAV
jgi:hypothetical protein